MNNTGDADPHHPAAPVHYLHELPFAEEKRLEELFKRLDKDSNGRIDIHDLSDSLKELGFCNTYAEVSGRVGKELLRTSGNDIESFLWTSVANRPMIHLRIVPLVIYPYTLYNTIH